MPKALLVLMCGVYLATSIAALFKNMILPLC